MSTTKLISSWLTSSLVAVVESSDAEVLATLDVGGGRKQTVQITIGKSRYRNAHRIEFMSRCCIARNAGFVREALKRNLKVPLGGLALGTTSNPKTIDIYHRILIPNDSLLDQHEIVSAVHAIAAQADQIERRQGEKDVF